MQRRRGGNQFRMSSILMLFTISGSLRRPAARRDDERRVPLVDVDVIDAEGLRGRGSSREQESDRLAEAMSGCAWPFPVECVAVAG